MNCGTTHTDPRIAGMGMLDLVDEVKRVREQRDQLRDENVQLRREAGGLTQDGRTVPDLESEVERLRDGIRDVADSMDLLTPDRTLPWEDQLRELLEENHDDR